MEERYIIKITPEGAITREAIAPADGQLEQLQRAVNGPIEAVRAYWPEHLEARALDLYADEEAHVKDELPPLNPTATGVAQNHVFGPAVVTRHDAQGRDIGLTAADADALEAWLASVGAAIRDWLNRRARELARGGCE